MSAIIEPTQAALEQTRNREHADCVVCGLACPSLGLQFRLVDDGAVETDFEAPDRFAGYAETLHGGVISSLLDGAMTNCLFAHDIVAVTAMLEVRFRHRIRTGRPMTVRAKVKRFATPLFVVESEIIQDGRRRATAVGKFMQTQDESAL